MTAARKKSAKRSATSGGGPPESYCFFIDECLGRYAIPAALRAAGHEIVLHTDRFAPGLSDVEWLSALHSLNVNWIVLTKDAQIRKRPLE